MRAAALILAAVLARGRAPEPVFADELQAPPRVPYVPKVGERVGMIAAELQDKWQCGDGIIALVEGMRARGENGAFNLPVNCPRIAFRWPYSVETDGADQFLVDSRTGERVMAILKNQKPTRRGKRARSVRRTGR
jgi:hypothetical protein